MHFGLDKHNILYLSTEKELHAAAIDDFEHPNSLINTNGVSSWNVKKLGLQSRTGKLAFDESFRCLWQYETSDSFADEDGFSRLGIFDNKGVADFNQIQAN